MLEYISESRDSGLCKKVLGFVSVLKHHVTSRELCSMMEISLHSDATLEDLEHIVQCCGSFLSLRDGNIYFAHQSVKDFLHNKKKGAFCETFPQGMEDVRREVCSKFLEVASRTVHRDIHGLQALGMSRDDVTPPQPDPLASVKYSCMYWIDRLGE